MRTIELAHPLEFGGEEIRELRIRRPKAKDLKGLNLENLTGDVVIELLARLTELPAKVIEDLDWEDLGPAMEVVEGFFGASRPAAGKTS